MDGTLYFVCFCCYCCIIYLLNRTFTKMQIILQWQLVELTIMQLVRIGQHRCNLPLYRFHRIPFGCMMVCWGWNIRSLVHLDVARSMIGKRWSCRWLFLWNRGRDEKGKKCSEMGKISSKWEKIVKQLKRGDKRNQKYKIGGKWKKRDKIEKRDLWRNW